MSESPEASEQETAAAPPKSKAMVTVLVAVGALVAGAGGGIVLAPRLVPATAASASNAGDHEAAEEEEKEGDSKEGHGGGGAGKIFKLDNIIVNPAGSEGSRFLMASVAYEVEDEKVEAALREHELRLRDLAVGVLESQTMTMLAQPFARDSIKRRLTTILVPIIGPKAKVRVYLPQFVIQ